MKKYLFILVFLAETAVSAVSAVAREKRQPVSPHDTWKPFYFAEIDKRTRVAHLRDLRSLPASKNGLEIRVWIGFGLWALEGFIIRRDANLWSATHLESIIANELRKSNCAKYLQAPGSGWQAFWKRIVGTGVLTLPDSSELKNEKLIDDGTSIVVETNVDGIYRAYHYNNPDYQRWRQARQIINISNRIAEEFDLEGFKFERRKP